MFRALMLSFTSSATQERIIVFGFRLISSSKEQKNEEWLSKKAGLYSLENAQ